MVGSKKEKAYLPLTRRLPGQSLRDEKERLCDDRLLPYLFAPAITWLVFLLESIHVWMKEPPQPKFWLSVAIIVTGWAAIGLPRLVPIFRRLNRGELGERKVAETLEELRAIGYRAVHDVVRNGYNIDHVLVGPEGVFAIETKYRSGRGEITFRNGEGLFIDGRPGENDSLKQARGNAREIHHMIRENSGIEQWVWPLVVFVGDWKIRNRWSTTDARVFTPEMLKRYLLDQPTELTRNEIALIASHLERSAKGHA